MRRALIALGIGAVAALACGVITVQQDPIAPVNQCTDDPSCTAVFLDAGAGSCTNGACSNTTFTPFVVVAVPTDQANLGGVTMPLPANYPVLRAQIAQKGALPLLSACLAAQQNAPATECDPIPPLTTFVNGNLQVRVGFDSVLYPPGLRPNNPPQGPLAATAMPVRVSVEMLWKDPATNQYAPARKLGIPLDDVIGTISLTSFLAGPTTSDTVVQGSAFAAQVPQPLSPGDPMNAYRLYITPVDPYVGVPPYTAPPVLQNTPLVSPIAAPGLTTIVASVNVAPISVTYDAPTSDGGSVIQPHTYQVAEATGAPSLEGWILHIDDQNGHRVSGSIVLPAGANKTVTVYEATTTQAQGQTLAGPDRYFETLYINPPPGQDYPRFAQAANPTSIVGPFTYPELPPPVELEGYTLTTDTQQKATAQITFVANGGTDSILEADLTTSAPLLLSKTTATTSLGQYDRTGLYPGMLRVYVVPDDPDLALTVIEKQVGPALVQQGITLPVNRRTHVKGRVVLPNGSPVFAADVIISASTDSPFLPKDDPLARPREVRGTTDTNGLFDVPSDPGFVDISIRPRDTTNFPWVVLTNRVVPPNDGTSDAGAQVTLGISDVVIPEPSRFTQAASGVLTDSVGNPIVHGIVRAYAFPPIASGVDGGAPQTRGARLLGMTVTDDNASFQLFVVPPQ